MDGFGGYTKKKGVTVISAGCDKEGNRMAVLMGEGDGRNNILSSELVQDQNTSSDVMKRSSLCQQMSSNYKSSCLYVRFTLFLPPPSLTSTPTIPNF